MPQDAYTLRYLCEELNEIFKGGKINRVIQPTTEEIVLTVYTGKRTEKLLISVNPSCPRIGVIDYEKDSPLTAPNFCMLLRKHILSGTIENISLIGFDRIVRIDITPSHEFFDSKEKVLYVELMGRYSNIILTEENKVLGGNRGINFFDNGVRPLIVGNDYVLPPNGEKKEPNDKTLIKYFEGFDGDNLAEYVSKGVQGIAQSTACEIVSEYYSKNKKYNFEGFYRFLSDFVYNKKTYPCVIRQGENIIDVCVFPYGSIKGETVSFKSLYLAEEYYFSEREKKKIFNEKRDRYNFLVNSAVKRVKKRLSAINSRYKEAENAEENRLKGELIISNIYRLKGGEKNCILDNYYDGSSVLIELDEKLSPSKNAERYYKKYNKQKRTLEALIPQRQVAESELQYLNGVLDEILLAENIEELKLIGEELCEAGIIEKQQSVKKKKVKEISYRVYDIEGFIVKVGRNNAENDKLTFGAKPSDIWLHAKDYHSAHTVIEKREKEIPQKVIEISAEITAYYSRGRDGGKTEIVYTEKKNVKKPPKSKLGFCLYSEFKSITVNPNKHADYEK